MASLTLKHVDQCISEWIWGSKRFKFPDWRRRICNIDWSIREWKKCCYAHDRRSWWSEKRRDMDWRQAGQQSSAGGARNCHDFSELYCVSANDSSWKCRTGLKTSRHRWKEIGKRTLEVLELLDLVEVRFAKVKNLSDLWKHRTALARAMILEPDAILMGWAASQCKSQISSSVDSGAGGIAGENRSYNTVCYKKCGRDGTIGKTKSDGKIDEKNLENGGKITWETLAKSFLLCYPINTFRKDSIF